MSRLTETSIRPERGRSEPAGVPVIEVLPGRSSSLGGLPIQRILPRSRRRLVGPWCFLDAFGPLAFASGKPMDVPPHPHIGLQTVSWLLEGEVLHHDSLGQEGLGRPGVLNLMTAGRGIAHSEETPPQNSGRLHGVQLWVALAEASRHVAPSFEQLDALPEVALDSGHVTVIMGSVAEATSPASTFSPIVGADIAAVRDGRLPVPLERDFEHALVPLKGTFRIGSDALETDALYYLGSGRSEIVLEAEPGSRAFLLGGAPFEETVLMWWNFVARTPDEIREAREDWQEKRPRFGDVKGYDGERLEAPAYVGGDRPSSA